jgi:hypothetical protein
MAAHRGGAVKVGGPDRVERVSALLFEFMNCCQRLQKRRWLFFKM